MEITFNWHKKIYFKHFYTQNILSLSQKVAWPGVQLLRQDIFFSSLSDWPATIFSLLAQICLILHPFNSDFVVVVLSGCVEDLFVMYSCNYEFEQSVFLSVVSLIKGDWNTWKLFDLQIQIIFPQVKLSTMILNICFSCEGYL